jgi:glutaredoxin
MSESDPVSITIYVTPISSACHQLADFLNKRKLTFTAFDVSSDPLALREMVRISGQHEVPVIVIGDQVILGFDHARLNRLLPLTKRDKVRLGVSIATVKPSSDLPNGAYVGGVSSGSLAERAGVRKGDIIVEMARHPIKNAPDVHATMAQILPGEQVSFTVWRAGHMIRMAARA